jgi:CDP-6-deoxy-D-xylo-4-hexulose-3-dehydrase
MLRSHGMVREIKDSRVEREIVKKYPELSPQFIFLYPGYNMRNTEIGAVLGISQLKRLDKNNEKRNKNFLFFLKNLSNKYFYKKFKIIGSSNYAFPLILKIKDLKKRDILEGIMKKNKIEFRRGNAGGGNQLRQPYIKKIIKWVEKDFKNVELVHHCGYYIGNFPELKKEKILKICKILNTIDLKNEN